MAQLSSGRRRAISLLPGSVGHKDAEQVVIIILTVLFYIKQRLIILRRGPCEQRRILHRLSKERYAALEVKRIVVVHRI